jgi:hypothetical protein
MIDEKREAAAKLRHAGRTAARDALPVHDPVFVARSEKFVDCSGSPDARHPWLGGQSVRAELRASLSLRERSGTGIIPPGWSRLGCSSTTCRTDRTGASGMIPTTLQSERDR